MTTRTVHNTRLMPRVILSTLLMFGLFYHNQAKANTSNTPAPGIQLAYFIGYHSYDGGYRQPVFYPPKKYLKGGAYWTGWRYVGYGCRQTCLIDRVTLNALRCNRLCF